MKNVKYYILFFSINNFACAMEHEAIVKTGDHQQFIEQLYRVNGLDPVMYHLPVEVKNKIFEIKKNEEGKDKKKFVSSSIWPRRRIIFLENLSARRLNRMLSSASEEKGVQNCLLDHAKAGKNVAHISANNRFYINLNPERAIYLPSEKEPIEMYITHQYIRGALYYKDISTLVVFIQEIETKGEYPIRYKYFRNFSTTKTTNYAYTFSPKPQVETLDEMLFFNMVDILVQTKKQKNMSDQQVLEEFLSQSKLPYDGREQSQDKKRKKDESDEGQAIKRLRKK